LKKSIFIICFAFAIGISQAQNVTIPDAKFLKALIGSGVDTNKDSIIQTSEAFVVTQLSLGSLSIANLTGIEAFTNITSLACPINALKTVDFSKNTLLQYLDIGGNASLTTLDLSKNTTLKNLDIIYTGLKTIDLSNNLQLEALACSGTVYSGFSLNNRLTSLDVSKNTMLSSLSATMNPSLKQICVNADQLANKVASWGKDSTCVWNANCSAVTTTAITEIAKLSVTPKLIRCYDILGKEIDPENAAYKGIIFYLYSDGSTKKVVRVE
jgi:hypothetical protein